MAVEKNRISTHLKSRTGESFQSKDGQTTYQRKTVKGMGMYTFVYGKGSKRVSETKHMTEQQADAYKSQLEKAGY